MKSRKIVNTSLVVFLILMLAFPAFAADNDDTKESDGIGFNDFFNKDGAEEVMDESAVSTPLDKMSGWGTFVIYGVLACYFGYCLILYFSGSPEKRSLGATGFVFGVLGIILFMVCSTTAFDALTWDYS